MISGLQTTYQCTTCPNTADTEKNPHAVDGWVIAPAVRCADCVAKTILELDKKSDDVIPAAYRPRHS